MELTEIKGIFDMNYGAPSPIIISNDSELYVSFYTNKETDSIDPYKRNIVYDTGVITLKFKIYLKYIFGIPGNETIEGHPYSKFGMKSYSFYELKESPLINEVQSIEKGHPYFDEKKWTKYKHYIITFHDNMFECIAQDYEIMKEKNTPLYLQATNILKELSLKDF